MQDLHSFGLELLPVFVMSSIVLCGWTIGRRGELTRERQRDIGDLRRQNAALRATTNAMSCQLELELEKRQLLESALTNAPIVVLATDAEGVVCLAHGSALSVAPEVLIGCDVLEVLDGLEGDLLRQVLSGDTVVTDLWTAGRVTRYRLGPRRDATGSVAGVTVAGYEMTDSEQDAKRPEVAKAEAQGAGSAKPRVLADMIHEIRNPLSGILNLSELMLHESSLSAAREYAGRIAASAGELSSLINHMLDFSRVEANKVVLEEVDFRPTEVLEKLQALMAPQAAAKRVQLRVEAGDDLPALNGDPTRLLQVLLNLVGNSIKFTSEGHVDVRLERASESNDGKRRIRCAVTDTGCGISPLNRARLFEPFIQESCSIARKFGGSGLGLAISKSLVELMGGAIAIDSEPGKGSTFAFTATFSRPRDSRRIGKLKRNRPARGSSRSWRLSGDNLQPVASRCARQPSRIDDPVGISRAVSGSS